MLKASGLFIIAVLLLVQGGASADKVHPGVSLSVDYAFFDVLQSNAIQPLVQLFLVNKTVNQSITLAHGNAGEFLYVNATFANPTVKNVSLNWNTTHLLVDAGNNTSNVTINDLSASVTVEYSILSKIGNFKGVAQISLVGLSVNAGVNFVPNANGSHYYPQLKSAEFSFAYVNVAFDSWMTNIVSEMVTFLINDLAKGFITEALSTILVKNANPLIKESLENGILLNYKELNISVVIPEEPVVNTQDGKSYGVFSFLLNMTNNETGDVAPTNFRDELPKRIIGEQVQLFISSNLINQAVWAAFQLDLINITLSNAALPASVPISLNTTALRILLPQLADQFGEGKGVYVHVYEAGKNPSLRVRDGRIVGHLPVGVSFHVDTDSSSYPQAFEECVTCVKAVELNASALLDLTLFNQDSNHFGLFIVNAEIVDLGVSVGKDVVAADLKNSLNRLLAGLIPTINDQLKAGIQDPLEGTMGIQNSTLGINNHHLSFQLSMKKFT